MTNNIVDNVQLNTKGLNGLKGISALVIALFSHYYFLVEDMFPFYNRYTGFIWENAACVVDLFFVISGFLMAYLYKDKITKNKTTFTSFIVKRISRFYPLFVATLVITLVFQIIYSHSYGNFFAYKFITDNSVMSFVLNLLCLQGTSLVSSSFNAPSWYLSSLLVDYIVFYIVTYFSGKYKKEIWSYIFLSFVGIFMAVSGYYSVVVPARAVLGFFLGCVLCEVCKWSCKPENKNEKRVLVALAIVSIAGFFFIGAVYGTWIMGRHDNIVTLLTLTVWPAIVYLIISVKSVGAVFSNKALMFVGKISFSMYLIHYPAMIMLDYINKKLDLGLNFQGEKAFCIYAVYICICAILTYYGIERPLGKLVKGYLDGKEL